MAEQSPFDTGTALAWGALSILPALLISSRGHERKLNGSYTAQTTWMKLKKDDLLETYKLEQRPAAESDSASTEAQ